MRTHHPEMFDPLAVPVADCQPQQHQEPYYSKRSNKESKSEEEEGSLGVIEELRFVIGEVWAPASASHFLTRLSSISISIPIFIFISISICYSKDRLLSDLQPPVVLFTLSAAKFCH